MYAPDENEPFFICKIYDADIMDRYVRTLESCFINEKKIPGLVNIVPIDEQYVSINRIHSHDYFQIIFIDKGAAKHTIEYDNGILMEPRSVSVIFPKQLHQITFTSGTEGIIVMFDEVLFCSDILKKELKSYTKDLYKKLNLIRREQIDYIKLRKMVDNINYLLLNITPIKKEQIRFYIKILLLQLIEDVHEDTLPQKSLPTVNLFARYKELIEEQFRETKTVAAYAGQIGISSRKLNQICKTEAGITALAVIHERLMIEIRRLLLFSGESMKEIAYELGFSSTPAFNKFVFSQTGKKPSELKNITS